RDDLVTGVQTCALPISAEAALAGTAAVKPGTAKSPFSVLCSDAEKDHASVKSLYDAMLAAKKQNGEAGAAASFDSFKAFVKKKRSEERRVGKEWAAWRR